MKNKETKETKETKEKTETEEFSKENNNFSKISDTICSNCNLIDSVSYLMIIIKFDEMIFPVEESLFIDILKEIISKEKFKKMLKKIENLKNIIVSSEIEISSSLNTLNQVTNHTDISNNNSILASSNSNINRNRFKEYLQLFTHTFFSENFLGEPSQYYKSKLHYRVLLLLLTSNLHESFSQSILGILSSILYDDYLNVVYSCSVISDSDYYELILFEKNRFDYLITDMAESFINMKIKYRNEEIVKSPSAITVFTDSLIKYLGYDNYESYSDTYMKEKKNKEEEKIKVNNNNFQKIN